MKVTWLGQAGLLFEKGDFRILVDPYLSDSVKEVNPANYRRVPVDSRFFEIRPNVMIFTHNHLDHYDPETASYFLTPNSGTTVLAPASVWHEVRKFGGNNNYVYFNRHTSWSDGDFCFTAIKAEHSDPDAIGVLIDDGEHRWYITGDTLYNETIFADLPSDIYAMFLPVNGVGNNMNLTDAARFCKKVQPRFAVPFHCGLFDAIDMNKLNYESKIIPQIYKEVRFQ